ncbi:MAG: MBL fold metallo-hydrolase [Chloroflexi bacterium]|nr:MBL fold metallo-hydrolase [Chloroflexota bacterium]
MFSVQFLGSGDAFGSGGRHQACVLVRTDTTRFHIDCGSSSLIAMRRFEVDPVEIDAILISHLHGDHFGGLPFFILEAQFISRRTKPLVVAGPPGLEARVRQAQEVLFPGSSQPQQKFALEFVEPNEGSETRVGSLAATPYSVAHASGAPAYAWRIQCGDKVIAYSGDTEWTDALVWVGKGADLFICEAYYFEKKVRYHLDYQALMSHRDELGCRRLILTHMNDDMLSRLEDVNMEWAEDGKCVIV